MKAHEGTARLEHRLGQARVDKAKVRLEHEVEQQRVALGHVAQWRHGCWVEQA
jgi:hypothetical protein